MGAAGESGVDFKIFVLRGMNLPNINDFLVPFNDNRFLKPAMVELARRHDPTSDLEALDAKIHSNNMRPFTVIMFGVVLDKTGTEAQNLAVLDQKHEAVSLLEPFLKKYGGVAVEAFFWIYEKPNEALLACMEARRAVIEYNKTAEATGSRPVEISGFGLHSGTLLFVEGTDVHWGDPVNTASKLGQDLAETNDVYVMPVVKEAADQDERCKDFRYSTRELVKSKVTFTCYSVTDCD